MKLGRVKKQTIRKRFFLHSLHRNFTRLAVITQKTTIKVENLEGGGVENKPNCSNLEFPKKCC